jgi:hypothetical protein
MNGHESHGAVAVARIIHLDDAIAKIDMGIRLEVHIRNAPGD